LSHPSKRASVLAAFAAVYIVWGSTYLAIRVTVETVPPLFAAAIRFSIAGLVLLAWAGIRGAQGPRGAEWRSLALLGFLMFLIPYSTLFWAETRIPSGIASVLVATVPLWTALLEMFVFRREPPRWTTLGAIVLGLAGVAMLAFDPAAGSASVLACFVVAASGLSWSIGTALITILALPRSDFVRSGAQMTIGGAMLRAGSMLLREVPPPPAMSAAAAGAIAYQVVAGSLVAFTAYAWLLPRVSSTKVTSYAYVNPVVALVIGRELGEEEVGPRTIAGCVLVLASTAALLLRRRQS